jgi:hypothetical protein
LGFLTNSSDNAGSHGTKSPLTSALCCLLKSRLRQRNANLEKTGYSSGGTFIPLGGAKQPGAKIVHLGSRRKVEPGRSRSNGRPIRTPGSPSGNRPRGVV